MFVFLVLVVVAVVLLSVRRRRREGRTYGALTTAVARPVDGPRFSRYPSSRLRWR